MAIIVIYLSTCSILSKIKYCTAIHETFLHFPSQTSMRKHPRTEREPHVRPTARHRGEAGSVTAAKTRADSRTCSIRVPRPEELLQRERIAATEVGCLSVSKE